MADEGDKDIVSRAVDYAALQLLADAYRDEHGYGGTIEALLKKGNVNGAVEEAVACYTQEFNAAKAVVIENNAAAAAQRAENGEREDIRHNAQQARIGARAIRDFLFK